MRVVFAWSETERCAQLLSNSPSVRNGICTSVAQLEAAIADFLRLHNANPKPFIWTAKAADILAKVTRARAALLKVRN